MTTDSDPDQLQRSIELGKSLIEAAKAQDVKTVRECVAEGANVNLDANMALWWACYNGNMDVFECIYSHSKALSSPAICDMVTVALSSGFPEPIRQLLQNAPNRTKLDALTTMMDDTTTIDATFNPIVEMVCQMLPTVALRRRLNTWDWSKANKRQLNLRHLVVAQETKRELTKTLASQSATRSKRIPKM